MASVDCSSPDRPGPVLGFSGKVVGNMPRNPLDERVQHGNPLRGKVTPFNWPTGCVGFLFVFSHRSENAAIPDQFDKRFHELKIIHHGGSDREIAELPERDIPDSGEDIQDDDFVGYIGVPVHTDTPLRGNARRGERPIGRAAPL